MKEIIKIVIKGCSGYCPYEYAYKDKLTLTSGSIAYEYIPEAESTVNLPRKWKYNTNSVGFETAFKNIADLIDKIFDTELDADFMVTDVGFIEFIVTYVDKTKKSEMLWTTGEAFKEIFSLIKQLVPQAEDIPEVIKTDEDYENSNND